MINYRYNNNDRGCNESQKGILANTLRKLIDEMEGKGKFIGLTRGQRLYVLVDEPSRGVTIMNTAYLTKEFQHDLIKRANKRYHEVMLDKNSEGYVLSNISGNKPYPLTVFKMNNGLKCQQEQKTLYVKMALNLAFNSEIRHASKSPQSLFRYQVGEDSKCLAACKKLMPEAQLQEYVEERLLR